jgi:hypothetical protein
MQRLWQKNKRDGAGWLREIALKQTPAPKGVSSKASLSEKIARSLGSPQATSGVNFGGRGGLSLKPAMPLTS